MSEERGKLIEGYIPETVKKGYQPAKTSEPQPVGDPQGGYVPTTSGDRTTPPGKE